MMFTALTRSKIERLVLVVTLALLALWTTRVLGAGDHSSTRDLSPYRACGLNC